MMIPTLGILTRIFMIFHVKSTNQRLCNGLRLCNSLDSSKILLWQPEHSFRKRST